MDKNLMKNIVILKDLPSNMIEEAFVVFKNNVKVHKLKKIENAKMTENKELRDGKEYILKEAEMIVSDYLNKIENKEYELVAGNRKIKEKYKRLRYLTLFFGMFSILSVFLILIKR